MHREEVLDSSKEGFVEKVSSFLESMSSCMGKLTYAFNEDKPKNIQNVETLRHLATTDYSKISDEKRSKYVRFNFYLIALSSKLILLEEEIPEEAISNFIKHFPSKQHTRSELKKLFISASKDPLGAEHYALKTKSLFPENYNLLKEIIALLFSVSQSSEYMTTDEMGYIYSVAKLFSFSNRECQQILRRILLGNESDPYKILAVYKDVTKAELTKAYKELARTYHPDNFTHRYKIAEEYVALMKIKFDNIKLSFDQIKQQKKY